jgi:hypothetical protein
MNHFTNKKGWNAIRASSPWVFKAHKQRGGRPTGAYFTTLDTSHPNFFKIARVPKKKQQYQFEFTDAGDLTPRKGPLGKYVFYSPTDYKVARSRQIYEGPA